MQSYSQITHPMLLESHSFTNMIIPQAVQLHQVTRQLIIPIQNPLQKINQNATHYSRQASPFTTMVRTTSRSIYPLALNRNTSRDRLINQTQRVIPLCKSPPRKFIRTNSNPRPMIPKQQQFSDQYDLQKGQIQQQLDRIFNKLGNMDQSLNDLSKTVLRDQSSQKLDLKKSQQKSIDTGDQESTQHCLSSTFGGKFQTPHRGRTHNDNKSNSYFHESQVNEDINKIQVLKGVKFGEFYYFGDINEESQREGYGTMYNETGQIVYCGYWLKDRYHNRGKLYFYDEPSKQIIDIESFQNQAKVESNKISYTGQFILGEIKGLGQMQFYKGVGQQKYIFYGRFIGGVFHGHGTVIEYAQNFDNEENQGIEGEWKNGICQTERQYSPKKIEY